MTYVQILVATDGRITIIDKPEGVQLDVVHVTDEELDMSSNQFEVFEDGQRVA